MSAGIFIIVYVASFTDMETSDNKTNELWTAKLSIECLSIAILVMSNYLLKETKKLREDIETFKNATVTAVPV